MIVNHYKVVDRILKAVSNETPRFKIAVQYCRVELSRSEWILQDFYDVAVPGASAGFIAACVWADPDLKDFRDRIEVRPLRWFQCRIGRTGHVRWPRQGIRAVLPSPFLKGYAQLQEVHKYER